MRNGYRGIPAKNDGAVVINTGLSVMTTCGHTVDLVRDETSKVAIVRVALTKCTGTAAEQYDLMSAADMLTQRAKRFLGPGWTVVPWQPPKEISPMVVASALKTIDTRTKGSGV